MGRPSFVRFAQAFKDMLLCSREELVQLDQLLDLLSTDDWRRSRHLDPVCGRPDRPHLYAASGSLLRESVIGCDQDRCRRVSARQVETVIDRMVHVHGESRGMIQEIGTAMKRDGLREPRQLLEVRLRVRDLASVDLLPDNVRVLNKQDIGSVQTNPRGKQLKGFLGVRLRHEPLGDDARINRQLHRSRSSRSKATLSVWGVPAVSAAICCTRARN